MSSNDIDLQKLAFHKVLRVSRVEFDADAGAFNATVDQEMREALAHHIQRVKIEKTFGEFYIEAKLDLYVATPSEFWGAVNFIADRQALRYGYQRSRMQQDVDRIKELEATLQRLKVHLSVEVQDFVNRVLQNGK